MKKIIDVLVSWNRREISREDALLELWDIVSNDPDEELKREWDRRNKEALL